MEIESLITNLQSSNQREVFMTESIDIQALNDKARAMRLEVLDVTTKVASGHVSSSYSAV